MLRLPNRLRKALKALDKLKNAMDNNNFREAYRLYTFFPKASPMLGFSFSFLCCEGSEIERHKRKWGKIAWN